MTKLNKKLMELAHDCVFNKAKYLENQYTLSVADLSADDKQKFLSAVLDFHKHADLHIQECLDSACQDRMYAEMESFGGYND